MIHDVIVCSIVLIMRAAGREFIIYSNALRNKFIFFIVIIAFRNVRDVSVTDCKITEDGVRPERIMLHALN